MADDLTAFLTARLNEEYLLAHRFVYVDGGEWTAEVLARLWWFSDPPKSRSATDPIIQHAARYNPARIVREVEAKQAILAEHRPTDWKAYGDLMCFRCRLDDDEPIPDGHHWVPWPCPTVRQLAAVYSDHPDYHQEWAPAPATISP
jgi:Family of unknown function (DUF6221)